MRWPCWSDEVASSFAVAPAEWSTALARRSRPGVPSTVLDAPPRRLGRAEQHAGRAGRVGVAKAAWFPTFSLTANGGYAVARDQGPVQGRRAGPGAWARCCRCRFLTAAAARPACRAPMPNSTSRWPATASRSLVAFKDVEDQLARPCACWQEQSEAQSQAGGLGQRATVLSDSRYRNGFVSQLELLDAQPQRTAQPPPGAAGEVGAVPGDRGADSRHWRRMGSSGARGCGRRTDQDSHALKSDGRPDDPGLKLTA